MKFHISEIKKMAGEICKHNQKGFCKFGDHCRKKHINDICTSDCQDKSCNLRHPRTCRYFILNGTCKFGEMCAYTHKETKQDILIMSLQKELKATKDKVDSLEVLLKV